MKTYPIVDRIPSEALRSIGLDPRDVTQPLASLDIPGGALRNGEKAPNGKLLDWLKGAKTGEFREPRKGEWFLSGSIPEAYYAPNDLGTKYHILKIVKVRKVVTETETLIPL